MHDYREKEFKKKKRRYKEWQRKALKIKQLRSTRVKPFSDRTYAEQQKNETLKMLRGKA